MKKLVFWDWVGTLVSSDFFFNFNRSASSSFDARGTSSASSTSGNLALLEQAHKYARIENSVSYIPYAWTLVDKFHSAGYKQVIVSNGSLSEVTVQLQHAPFRKFDLVLTVSEFNPKPDRQMFDHALNQLQLKADDALFIADSPVDEVAAQTVGLDFYKVDTHLLSYLKIAQAFDFVA